MSAYCIDIALGLVFAGLCLSRRSHERTAGVQRREPVDLTPIIVASALTAAAIAGLAG